ncbi:RPM1-interacting protein 4-like isoform X2 [Mercurialis annua]|uniref:RPM1-interacting protein 4-like isoform X2 n=1 Tax=Mercurialis annua TaxID=3986 RepID=UPI00215DD724|nr:RPM1-interacting protein 4-like isoform X2 [Mercurialis annua]
MASAEQRSKVPKFGDWDSDDNVPYTAFFDNARTDKINPNDPLQNPDAFLHHQVQYRSSASDGPREVSSSAAHKSKSDYQRRQKSSSNYFRQPTTAQPSHERRTASVPKFGAWDEADPSSGEGFTVIFNRVKEEKQVASTHFPPQPTSTSSPSKVRWCLFPWGCKP